MSLDILRVKFSGNFDGILCFKEIFVNLLRYKLTTKYGKS